MKGDEENDNNELYKYGWIDGTRIRSSIVDWLDMWSWRYWVKEPYWFKMKPYLHTGIRGYKTYKVHINGITRIMSRVLYKLYNEKWNITDSSDTNQIDHINQNSLDNRIENLRILTHQQNTWNKTFRGTTQQKNGKWKAQIMVNGKYKSKVRDTELEAHEQYLIWKEELHSIPNN